jgi:hypothetical protein
MTTTHGPTIPAADERAADLVLARIHLRLGSIGLARAELEAMAGRNSLDIDGIRDLAEARWRTGDLAGAGDAASAYLHERPEDPLALLITAEMQAHLGRPGEARRIAGRVVDRSAGPVDRMFAGMPRSSIWPVEPGSRVEPAGTLFEDVPSGPAWLGGGIPGLSTERDGAEMTEPGDKHVTGGPGLWEHAAVAAPILPDPTQLLARGREALDADRPGRAAAALALAIRAEPALAPAVLDLLAGRDEPVLALVRGDAHRIVGHEGEALRDYVAAVEAIGMARSSDRSTRARSRKVDRPTPPPPEAATDPGDTVELAGGPDEPIDAKETP